MAVKHTMLANVAVLERGGAWRPLSARWDRAVNAPLRWAADGAAAAASAPRSAAAAISGATRSEAAAPRSPHEGGWVQLLRRRRRHHRDRRRRDAAPGRIHARAPGRAPIRIEQFNDALLAGYRFGRARGKDDRRRQRRAGADVARLPAGFDAKKAKKYPRAAQHPRRPARGLGRHLPLPLEQPALRGAGLRRRLRQLPRLERLRLRLPRQHHAPLGRARAAGHRGRDRLAAEAAAGPTASASSPAAAATVASWSPG